MPQALSPILFVKRAEASIRMNVTALTRASSAAGT